MSKFLHSEIQEDICIDAGLYRIITIILVGISNSNNRVVISAFIFGSRLITHPLLVGSQLSWLWV